MSTLTTINAWRLAQLDIIHLFDTKQSTCLDVAKEVKLRERQSLAQAELDSNYPFDVSIFVVPIKNNIS